MALWIRTLEDTGETVAETVRPANGRSFNLREMQSFVGGHIEALRLHDTNPPLIMWLNEDGKRLQLPYNTVATFMALTHTGIDPNDCVVGPVLVANYTESGEGDGDADE